VSESPWTNPEDLPANASSQWPREDPDPQPLADWERELLDPDFVAKAEVADPAPAPATVVRRAGERAPATTIRHRTRLDYGLLVRVDRFGNPVVRFFGDRTEYPYSWDKIEIVSSSEYETVPGGFEVGLYVDGDGDLWRALGGCPEEPGTECEMGSSGNPEDAGAICHQCGTDFPEPVFYRMVSCHGLPARSRSEMSREDILEFTGALEPAGSPEAQALREATADTNGEALLGGLIVTVSVCLAVLILVALYRWISG
jgi:hypothetical protein